MPSSAGEETRAAARERLLAATTGSRPPTHLELVGRRRDVAHRAHRGLRDGRAPCVACDVGAPLATVADAESCMAGRQPTDQQYDHHQSAHDPYPSDVALQRLLRPGPSADLTSQNVGNDRRFFPDAAASPRSSPDESDVGRTTEWRQDRKLLRAPGVQSHFWRPRPLHRKSDRSRLMAASCSPAAGLSGENVCALQTSLLKELLNPPSSCPALCRASTPFFFRRQGVDGRDKPGHDDEGKSYNLVSFPGQPCAFAGMTVNGRAIREGIEPAGRGA